MTIGYDVEEGDEEDGEGKEIDHAAIFGCEQLNLGQQKLKSRKAESRSVHSRTRNR